MATSVALCVALTLFCVYFIHCSPDGAPSQTCMIMTPQHTGTPSACRPSYMVEVDQVHYAPGEDIEVTVHGVSLNDQFKEILLIAKEIKTNNIVGRWSSRDTKVQSVSCGNGIASLTHSAHENTRSIQAVWHAPSKSVGRVTIQATVIKSLDEYFVDCYNTTLIPISNRMMRTPMPVTIVHDPVNVTTVPNSTDPGSSTAATTTEVGVNINWNIAGGTTTVRMVVSNLKISMWAAIGLSEDEKMGEDHVFACLRQSDGTVFVKRMTNPGGHLRHLATVDGGSGGTFTAKTGKTENEMSICEFTLSNFEKRAVRRIERHDDGLVLEQQKDYTPLIAIGRLTADNTLLKHAMDSRAARPQLVRLNRQESIVYNLVLGNEKTNFMKAHGIIMIFTWMLVVSTGFLVARYFKKAWPNQKLCGEVVWFAIHRALMSAAALLTLLGFFFILVYKQGTWVNEHSRKEYAHSIIGIIVVCFATIQPILALFRCHPGDKYRFIFNYIHAFIGLSSFFLSIAAIFLATFFGQFNFRLNDSWGILVAWSCWVVIILIAFECLEYYFRNNSRSPTTHPAKTNAFPMNGRAGSLETTAGDDEKLLVNPLKDRIKGLLLVLHIFVALGLSLALSILTGQSNMSS